MSNKTYDILKWAAQLLLPALGTLYFALASIWGFPYGEQIDRAYLTIVQPVYIISAATNPSH